MKLMTIHSDFARRIINKYRPVIPDPGFDDNLIYREEEAKDRQPEARMNELRLKLNLIFNTIRQNDTAVLINQPVLQKILSQAVLNQTIQNQIVQNRMVQNQTFQNQTIQNRIVQNQAIRNQTVQNQTVQNQKVQNQTVQGQTVIHTTAPHQLDLQGSNLQQLHLQQPDSHQDSRQNFYQDVHQNFYQNFYQMEYRKPAGDGSEQDPDAKPDTHFKSEQILKSVYDLPHWNPEEKNHFYRLVRETWGEEKAAETERLLKDKPKEHSDSIRRMVQILYQKNPHQIKLLADQVDKVYRVPQVRASFEDPSAADRSYTERSLTERSLAERSIADRTLKVRPLAEPALIERLPAERSIADRALTNRPLTDRAFAGRSASEPADVKTAAAELSHVKPAGAELSYVKTMDKNPAGTQEMHIESLYAEPLQADKQPADSPYNRQISHLRRPMQPDSAAPRMAAAAQDFAQSQISGQPRSYAQRQSFSQSQISAQPQTFAQHLISGSPQLSPSLAGRTSGDLQPALRYAQSLPPEPVTVHPSPVHPSPVRQRPSSGSRENVPANEPDAFTVPDRQPLAYRQENEKNRISPIEKELKSLEKRMALQEETVTLLNQKGTGEEEQLRVQKTVSEVTRQVMHNLEKEMRLERMKRGRL